jgi:uncharacterized protein involved in outer membrane biogenesis
MKKIIIILASIVTLLLAAAIIIPVIYEDDIREMVKSSIDENIDAHVYFDPSKFSLTLFKTFPNPTASIGDFGIVGKAPFEGDTLLSVGSFDITIDLFSLFGDSYRIKSIKLSEPRINVIALKSGEANYEIVAESAEEEETTEEEAATEFNLRIENWSIANGYLRYRDETMDFDMILEGLEHNGSGDISLDLYDLNTLTVVKKAFVSYEGVNYLNGQSIDIDATLNINMPEFKFTFKDNEAKVNDFAMSFDGFVAMPGEDIDMDIRFASVNSSIKSLYSLVPGAYTEGYESVKAEGTMSFDGFVKGIYNETSMPAYHVALKAENGMISYPDLPAPIKNINIDMLVDCADGVIDNTSVNISKMHMDLGSNPVDGTFILRNLKDYSMKADVNAKLNLAELSTIFPMEGLDMKGLFDLNIKADGVYDSIKNIMPAITATMNLENGYIKSSEFPKALENMSFRSQVDGSTGKMEDMVVKVEDFKMIMEGEELSASLTLKNMVDYQWDLRAKGGLDLQVISEVYPMEGMAYSGNLLADIATRGKYSDVEAERYDRFPTEGVVELKNFTFSSADLPQGMKIAHTKVSLDPKQINVESFDGTLGKSDMKLQGFISNYIDYIFQENALLKGKMSLRSNLLDLNEWMSDEEASAEEASDDTTAMEVVAIPRNIDFEFNSNIKQILYDNLNLQQAKGLLTVRDGVLDMSNLSFNLLGGTIVMNGKYDTRVPETPVFDYQLNIQKLSIPQAYTSFSTVQAFAPMAKLMSGNFSTNFSISGKLKDDLSPVLESLNGKGLIEIADAFMKESKLVSGISGFMKSDVGSSQLSLKDVLMKASLENGRAYVSPFDIQMAGRKATVGGSIGADGSLDYAVNTEVDAGAVGQQVNQLLASVTGDQAKAASSKINLHFNVGGTYDKPQINLAGSTSADGTTTTVKEQVKQEVKQEAQKQVDVAKKEAEAKVQEETQKVIEEGEKQLQQQADTLKKEITKNLEEEAGKVVGEQLDSTATELKESLKSLFKKKKKN